MYSELTFPTRDDAPGAGSMVKISGVGRPMRAQASADGRTYLYPDWPGKNRHERRAAEAEARRLR